MTVSGKFGQKFNNLENLFIQTLLFTSAEEKYEKWKELQKLKLRGQL